MKDEKKIHYKDIGDVVYHKNRRARNIAIRISAAGMVRVTVPAGCTVQRAESFVLQKRSWILRKTKGLEQRRQRDLVWEPGDMVSFRGGRIYIDQGQASAIQVTAKENSYSILLPLGYNMHVDGYAAVLREQVAAIGLQQAKRQLPGILSNLAQRHGLSYTRVSVKRMRTRWGSCSPKNNISLNSGLIFLPEALIEYVCLHELVHTVHKNHGASFWDALYILMPEAKMRRRELRGMTII
ncbi:MAG: M48 family metallopeptidase [Bacteroidales bacterium]|nr:M48 family metallopeptidase [Bacteroidales bacterium]